MGSASHIGDHASELLDAARAMHAAAGEPGSSEAATLALARLEEALQALSAGWYRVAADAAPAMFERRDPSSRPASRAATHGLGREQEALLVGRLHDVAAAFARCARMCRDARPTVATLTERREPAERRARELPGSRRDEAEVTAEPSVVPTSGAGS